MAAEMTMVDKTLTPTENITELLFSFCDTAKT